MDQQLEIGVPSNHAPPPFLSKTYDMVDDPATDSMVSWTNHSTSFVVWKVAEFAREILPKYFKHNNFSSFVRQLNTYGFRKVDPDRWEFANEGFLRGHKNLLKTISRRKYSHVQPPHPQPSPQVHNSPPVGSFVEVGKFGLDEEVEGLKRDKNVLMQELVRLRQQQQATDHQLQTVGQRVHLMEQHQQQMMSFLAKAMQSPGFVSQLVHQQNEISNRHISGVSKKRRLPNQDEENVAANLGASLPDRQIVNYQPLMNEAAKAVLRQILNINASARLEQKINTAKGYLIDNVPSSPDALQAGSSSTRISGVTLSEVLPSLQPHLASEPGSQFHCTSSVISEVQSSAGLIAGEAKVHQIPQTNILNHQDVVLSAFPQADGILPENNAKDPEIRFKGSVDTMPGFVDNGLPGVPNGFSSDPDVHILLDKIPRLPSINDSFWEQFLSHSSLAGERVEIDSKSLEGNFDSELLTGQTSDWDNLKNVNHLTEQMGLLVSGAKRG